MFDRDLLKHAAEFRRYLRNHQYEVDETGGVVFAKAAARGAGVYVHDVNGLDPQISENNLPDEGLIYLLSVGLNNGTKLATWYLALYAANYTPLAGLTAASFPATASEITSGTEGYSEATRQVWTPTAPTTPLIDNLLNKAAFTIVTASSLTVYGAALLSESAKGAVTGKIMSATKFSAARTLYDTDVFNLAYRVTLTST